MPLGHSFQTAIKDELKLNLRDENVCVCSCSNKAMNIFKYEHFYNAAKKNFSTEHQAQRVMLYEMTLFFFYFFKCS